MEKAEVTAKDVAALLRTVESESSDISKLRSEVARLKLESNKPFVAEKLKKTSKLSFERVDDGFVDTDFEDEIVIYLDAINSLNGDFNLDDLLEILPSKDNYNYLRINYRLQCEIIKNIKSIMEASKDDKDFLELLPDEEKKLQLLREALSYEDEDVTSNGVCNKIILVPNLSGNIPIIDDVERLPYDVYDDILELINSIIEGKFKRIKGFTHINDLSGICEVRKGDLRVIYTRISENTYAIITTFLKKIESDQYYRDNLNRKANNYRSVEGILRSNLDNPDFIRENDLQVQRLFSMLKKEEDIKVLGKGGINE